MGRCLSRYLYLVLLVLFWFVVGSSPVAAGTGFADVSDSYWAAKHISKMSALGVVRGYEDGTFRPEQTVSQVEAVVMAARSISKVLSYTTDIPFDVPGWAAQDVARARELGLLKDNEEFYARADANRAWVVRLLVRMIGKEEEAWGVQALPGFTDSYLIPNWAAGYVKVAQENNLVGGYADNTFRPDRAVTRAELAVFLSRAQDYLEASPLSLKGRLLEVSTSRLTISDTRGQRRTFMVPYNVPVYDNSGLISVGELRPYDYVSLITDGDSVKYLEKLSGEAVTSVVSGSVRRVYSEKGALVLEVPSGEYRTLYLPEETVISEDGNTLKEALNSLQLGDQVEVSLNALGYISSFVINSRSQEAFNEGIVYDLYMEGNLITLQSDDGRLSSYRLAEQVKVVTGDQRFASLADIRKGDKVRLVIENLAVVKIEVVQASSRLDISGTIMAISPQDRVITLDVQGQLKAFRVVAGAEIKLSGLENAMLSDAVVGDEVQAHVEDGAITVLEIKERTVESDLNGTVVGVDTRSNILTLRDKKDSLLAYEVKDNARVVIDGESTTLSSVKKDMRVNVRLVDGKIVFLEVDNNPEGTVVSIDDKGLLLVLADSDGKRETYVIDEDVDVYSRDDRDELDEIKRGDYVKLTLDSSSVVIKIKLRAEMLLQVETVRESYDRIDTRDKDGDRVRLYIADEAELVIPGINYPDVEDVKENDIVRALFIGNDLKRVEVLQPKQGQVVSIDNYAKTVTLKYSDNEIATLDFDRYCEIIIGSNRYDSLDRLNTGDRVEVIENVKGGYDFKVIYRSTL